MVLDSANNETKKRRAFASATGDSRIVYNVAAKKGSVICKSLNGEFVLDCFLVLTISITNHASSATSLMLFYSAYFDPNMRDKTTPVQVSLEYELIGSDINGVGSPRPVIDPLAERIQPHTITLSKRCDRCNPDLTISGKFVVSLNGNGTFTYLLLYCWRTCLVV